MAAASHLMAYHQINGEPQEEKKVPIATLHICVYHTLYVHYAHFTVTQLKGHFTYTTEFNCEINNSIF